MATLLVRSHRIPCLELDLLVSVLADLMLAEVFEELCRLASKGHILFALIGIPCKTWSVARVGSVSHPFQLRGRSPKSVHGLPNLTRAQQKQVRVADEIGRRAFTKIKPLFCKNKGLMQFKQ